MATEPSLPNQRSPFAAVAVCLLALCAFAALLTVANLGAAPSAGATTSPDPYPPIRLDNPQPGDANFRTFCEFSHAAFDDPIVHPGDRGAAHLHFFFGNTRTNAFSTPESIRTRGNSTCQGFTLNRSAYWIPAVFTSTDTPILPDRHDIYYKHLSEQPATEVQPLPQDLVMIAGDASGAPEDYLQIAYWRCSGWPYDAAHPNSDTIPACAVGDDVRMNVIFPSCWDGVNLDSVDHQSHMAYVEYDTQGSAACPASHPVAVPQLSLHFEWEVRDQPSLGWYLSSDRHGEMMMPGGSTLHADWMNGWHQATQDAWTTSCINEQRDCANGSLGDGRRLDRVMRIGNGRIPRMPGSVGPHCNGRPATIVGTSGADVLLGTDGDDVIVSYGGGDTIDGRGGADIICSGNGDDEILGGPGDDEIWSGGGNDTVDGGEGDDVIRGSLGDDALGGGVGQDTIFGGSGNDVVTGGEEANLLVGGRGADVLTGGWWEDAIFGGPDDDRIDGVGSYDRIWGGRGVDVCLFEEGRIRSCE